MGEAAQAVAIGLFAGWRNLPYDQEYAKTVLQWFIIMNVVQIILFFVVAENHPLPARFAKELKKPYDRMVVGHRLICLYNGFGAFLATAYWVLFIRGSNAARRILSTRRFYSAICVPTCSGIRFSWSIRGSSTSETYFTMLWGQSHTVA